MTDNEGDKDATEEVEASRGTAVRTPLYRASNAPRYGRQERIKQLQAMTGTKLICYLAGQNAPMTRDDILPLVDLFHMVPAGQRIDLLLQTPGGDVDAAEKMASMLRNRVGATGQLRVIVADYAKSAGTLIALAADTVLMSDSSELGPVDPQVPVPDGGRGSLRPAQSYVDGYEALVELVNQEPTSAGYRMMLDKYDPTLIDLCRKVLERSKKLAEQLLKRGMFRPEGRRPDGNFTAVAAELSDNRKWLWHGVPIDQSEAKRIGLDISYLPPSEAQWSELWSLYCEQRLALRTEESKLFESDYVSLPFD